MATDPTSPATKDDIQMLMGEIGKLYDANERCKDELKRHFDFTVETIRHELPGANVGLPSMSPATAFDRRGKHPRHEGSGCGLTIGMPSRTGVTTLVVLRGIELPLEVDGTGERALVIRPSEGLTDVGDCVRNGAPR